MKKILDFFRNLKIWQKLTVMGLVMAVPIGLLAVLLINTVTKLATFAEAEVNGVDYLTPLGKVIHLVPAHRGASFGFLNGDQAQQSRLAKIEADLEEAFKAVAVVDEKFGAKLTTIQIVDKKETRVPVSERFKLVKAKWAELKADGAKMKPEENFDKHNELMNSVKDLAADIGDASNLIYDPVSVTYALQDNLVYRLPQTADTLGQIRGISSGLAARKKITPVDKAKLYTLTGELGLIVRQVSDNVTLFNKTETVQERLKGEVATAEIAREKFMSQFIVKEVLEPEAVKADKDTLWINGTAAVDAYVGDEGLYQKSAPILRELLVERLKGYNRQIYYGILAILGGSALIFLVTYWISRFITRQVDSINSMFGQIGMGAFDARAAVRSEDELGVMASSLNAMLDNTLALIQSREERDEIQGSIMKLLEEVAGVADGDLTRDAEVTADVTGAIADSFNYMIEQLRKIIGNVQRATKQVSRTAQDITSSAGRLAHGSESQAAQILDTSAAVGQMTVSIQQVSENAGQSAMVAQQAFTLARNGNEAVKNTIAGMDRIRDSVQETAKRIKRLGESSQEIGQIIQLIDDIADRTSILALNASIQAAMAGEAGRGFAVVAEEVERLADRSTDATKKIATLIKTIQSETTEAVSAMEKGIQEVVDGSKLATEAGASLGEIESVSKQLADLIQTISVASKQQARASEGVAKSMAEISNVTQQTATGTKQAADAVNSLAKLAEELRGSVATFRLPELDPEDSIAGRISRMEIDLGELPRNGKVRLDQLGSRY